MGKAGLALAALLGSTVLTVAQTRQPASVATMPTSTPQEVDLLDKTGVWTPFGLIDSTQHRWTGVGAGLSLAGSPPGFINGNFAGASQNNSLFVNSTAASASAPEAAGFFNMTSATGAASGAGPTSAYKMGLAVQATANPGSGNIYAENIVTICNSGLGAFQCSGLELNLQNFNRDYPELSDPTGDALTITSAVAASTFKLEAAIKMGVVGSPGYLAHDGVLINPNTASDNTIHDAGNAAASYSDTGAHSSGGFIDSSTAPYSFASLGAKSAAAFFDSSTAPTGLAVQGSKSSAGIAESSSAPAGIAISGVKTAESILDQSTAPTGLAMQGAYSNAAIGDTSTSGRGLFLAGKYTGNPLEVDNNSVALFTISPAGAVNVLKGTVQLTPKSIANVLAISCAGGTNQGMLAFVVDTVASAVPVWHGAVAGGGAAIASSLVSCTGSQWQYE